MNEDDIREALGEWDKPHLSVLNCVRRLVIADKNTRARLQHVHASLKLRTCAQCMNLHPQIGPCTACGYDRTLVEDSSDD